MVDGLGRRISGTRSQLLSGGAAAAPASAPVLDELPPVAEGRPSATTEIASPSSHRFVAASELPAWATVFPYIIHGYRNPSVHNTAAACLESNLIREGNNEFWNVHTHFWPGIGTLIFLWVLASQPTYFAGSSEARASLWMCGIGASFMMIMSATAHTFHVMSDSMRGLCWRWDYLSIMCTLFGRQFMDFWLVLGVHDSSTFYYVQGAAIAMVAFILILTWHEKYLYIQIFGVWSLIPIVIWLAIVAFGPPSAAGFAAGYDMSALRSAAAWNLLSSASAVSGNLIYLAKVPERWSAPGSYDYIGNSHHYLHVTSAIASFAGMAATQYIAAYEMSVWKK